MNQFVSGTIREFNLFQWKGRYSEPYEHLSTWNHPPVRTDILLSTVQSMFVAFTYTWIKCRMVALTFSDCILIECLRFCDVEQNSFQIERSRDKLSNYDAVFTTKDCNLLCNWICEILCEYTHFDPMLNFILKRATFYLTSSSRYKVQSDWNEVTEVT